MAVEVILPRFNMDMEQGTVLRWLKQDGDRVDKGEPVCEVETNKVNMEVESPAAGILCRSWIQEGATVPVTAVLALIAADEQEASAIRRQPPPEPTSRGPSDHPSPQAPAAPTRAPAHSDPDGVRATPAVRRAAREAGIDLATLASDGHRVSMGDVRRAAGKPVLQGEPLSPTRRSIAARMVLAHTAPHVTLDVEVNFARLLAAREAWRIDRPSLTSILGAAVCRALDSHPLLNSTYERELLFTASDVNLAVAVARSEGLVAPVVREAQRLTVDELSAALRALEERALDGSLGLDDVQGGSFTITNLGPAGVDRFTALLNPPQVAILAAGRIARRVVAGASGVEVQPMGWLSLTCDHRVVDGEPAAAFLATLKMLIEEPSWLAT